MQFKRYYALPLVLAALLFLPQSVLAQSFVNSACEVGTAGPHVELDHGPQAWRSGDEVTISHSASQEIVAQTGVACPTAPNSYYRVFDLSDFGLTGGLEVTSVDLGIEVVQTEQETVVNIYTLDGELMTANLTLVSTATLEISGFDDGTVANVPITAEFSADEVLVVEWNVPNLQDDGAGVFFGANTAGQTGPTYIQAAACGATEPADLATLGFPDSAWVLNVNGTGMTTASEDGAVAQRVTLGQAYPNPVVGRADIPFSLESAQHVRVALYDALGREVAVAADRAFGAGDQSVSVNVRGLPNGIYFYRVSTEVQTLTRKMVVLQ